MGLYTKPTALPNGAEVSYWRWAELLQLNYDAREIHFKLAGFKTKGTAEPVTTRDFRLRGKQTFDFDAFFPKREAENIVSQCYAAAKAVDPLFKDAYMDEADQASLRGGAQT